MASAHLWRECQKHIPDEVLGEFNQRLLVAKRVFEQFWLPKEEVREYFMANAESPANRRTLQTIELLCNASQVVQELSLSEIETLSGLLQSERVPEYIRKEVEKYFNNKGTRGWDTDDRRIVPLAWREAGRNLTAASPR
jgi:hypothetical protein